MKKSLYVAIIVGSISAIILYGISWDTAWGLVGHGIFQSDTLELLSAFYGINLLQKAMEILGQRKRTSNETVKLFSSNRKNIMAMPFLMGLLPTAGTVLLAAPVVDDMSGGYLSKEEKAFVTSYYRHISESFLPTYSYIILAVNLSGISMGKLQMAMLPMVFMLFLLGYIFYVKKIPNKKQCEEYMNAKTRLMQLVKQYWAIILLVAVILFGNIAVHVAVYPVVVLFLIVNRFQAKELREIVSSALQLPIMLNTIVIMIFKEILLYSSVLEQIPEYLMTFHIPPLLIFGLLFFLGSLMVGSQAIIALGIPLAFASIPNGGAGLLVLAIGAVFSASQMSPTHVCLSIATEYFQCSFWDLIRKTLPLEVVFMVFTALYSSFLRLVF